MPDPDVKMLLERAHSGAAPVAERAPRKIYNGDPQSRTPGYAARPNRRALQRKRSTFRIVVFLFCCGLGIVLYIGNILKVNQTAAEVNRLRSDHARVMNNLALMRAEIDRKSGLDRINAIATGKLGLQYPDEQPVWFDVDNSRLNDVVASAPRERSQQNAR